LSILSLTNSSRAIISLIVSFSTIIFIVPLER
jgi:hypothetical protein